MATNDKSKDKSKDLDLIPAIKPAQDEVANYRRSGRSEAPRQSNFNGVLVFVIVLMAVMMGIGGFTLYQVQEKLDQANVLLAKGQDNIRNLESRLSQTGDTASQKFQSMESQIKTNVSEIDKLWAVSYRQNRPSIAENTKAIEQLKSTASKLDKDLKQVSGSMQQVKGSFDKFSKDMGEVRQGLLADYQEMTTQVSLVRGQVQDQAVKSEAVRRDVNALSQRMTDVDESIKTFDKYRQQMNQRLIDLQSQIQSAQTAP